MTVATDQGSDTVVAAAAPLWASVEAAQEVAAFGGSSYPTYREWVRRLLQGRTPLMGRLDTVALCGEPVRVLATARPSLVEVELLAQPNGSTGYVGFMHAAHIGADARRRTTHVVAARGVLATTADREAAPVELAAGTTVELLAGQGAQDPAEVLLASGAAVRCPMGALRPLDAAAPAAELLGIAAGFLGVPYLWGGTEASGIDCSGLVHLAARIGGHVVPRDAHHQWAATRFDADWDDLDAGDLIFFGASATLEGVDHVGVYAGEARMLHAPEAGRQVILEPISARARERAVGFGRYPAPREA
jgi:gamma-D-glutamyl-L-lysine dipeptidyl-peptidase